MVAQSSITQNKIEALIRELDEKYPAMKVQPGQQLDKIMFNAGQQDVVTFMKQYLGKPLVNPNRFTALELKEQRK